MNNLAPIVIFTYTRLETLKKTIESLKKNKMAKFSEIYIFSDCHKNKIDQPLVNSVRKYLKSIKGYKKINLISRKENYGLARNIINGVSSVIKKRKKVIVLEDDIIVSPNFLEYMNDSLIRYQNNKKIWHINSWNYEIRDHNVEYNAFFTRHMNCWGWATWEDRWKYFEKKPDKILKKFNKEKIFRFNIENNLNYYSQLKRNKDGKLNTWAIFWYANIFLKNGLCLSPLKTLSKNIGFDDHSEHQPNEDNSFKYINKNFFLKKSNKFSYPELIEEDFYMLKKIISFIKSQKKQNSLFKRLIFRVVNNLSFNSFSAANFFSKNILWSNYNSFKINKFKIQSLKNQKHLNLIQSPSFKLLFKAISDYRLKYKSTPKKILDVGGGLGENFLALKKIYKTNINATILENRTLVDLIKKNKINHCNFISDIDRILKEKKRFDIIIFSASLEYIENPYRILKKLSNLTKKIIIIGRINIGDTSKFRIQASTFQQNVPYTDYLPKNKKKLIFYPYQNLSIPKILHSLKFFKVLNKEYDDNNKINIILKNKYHAS
tara:strand:+ start:2626 stop:4266 length:1641 start_codon:yes stop_codon:yes gene_type:complete